MYDYLIVGAGLFGAVFADRAAQRGKRCLVLEKRGHIGGNAFCEDVEGVTVHKYGVHVFHTSDVRVWEYMNGFAEFNRFTYSPIANCNGELYSLPLNMNTFYKLWGVSSPGAAREVIDSRRAAIPEPRNLEERALSLVGADLYEMFIRGYTEKRWGRKCTDLPARMIERLPVRFTFDNDYYGDRFQGVPVGGYNRIFEKMLGRCDVKLGADFFGDRERYGYIADKVIFSGMIDEFYGYRFGRLEYRSLSFDTEVLDMPDFQGNAAVYYMSADIPYTRVVEHKHLEFGTQAKTVISYEYPAEYSAGNEPYYPINDARNEAVYARYMELAVRERNVVFGGRLGAYRRLDMWQAVSDALKCADALL